MVSMPHAKCGLAMCSMLALWHSGVAMQRTGEPWSWDLDLVLVLVSFSVSVSVAVVSEIYESPRLAVTGYRLWVQGISMSVNTHNNC